LGKEHLVGNKIAPFHQIATSCNKSVDCTPVFESLIVPTPSFCTDECLLCCGKVTKNPKLIGFWRNENWEIEFHRSRARLPRGTKTVRVHPMSFRPHALPAPRETDVKRAKDVDLETYWRVKRQKTRIKKRLREIDAFDSAALAYAR